MTPSPPLPRPFARLSAREAAVLVGCTEADLQMRERDGELFSFRSNRQVGRLYVAFELMPPWAGSVMSRLLTAIEPADGAAAFTFFCTVSEYLGGLSVSELLVGCRSASWRLDEGAAQALEWRLEERVALALRAAESFKACEQGW